MRLKKEKIVKNEKLTFRLSIDDLKKIKRLAMTYCEGNESEWCLYAALNFMPSGDELEDDKKTPCKKQGAVKTKRKIVRD